MRAVLFILLILCGLYLKTDQTAVMTSHKTAEVDLHFYLAYVGAPASLYFDNSAANVNGIVLFAQARCYFDLRVKDEPFLGYVVKVIQGEGDDGPMLVDNVGFPTQIYYGDVIAELGALSILIEAQMIQTGDSC